MKLVLLIVIVLILSYIIIFSILGYISRSGRTPGLIQGKLRKCQKPNCVCSEYIKAKSHYIDPIIINDQITLESLSIIKSAIKKAGGTILTDSREYISAVFTSL